MDKLVTVGRRARWIAEEALAVGMNTADVYPVETNTDAIGILQGLIRPGDVVLIKGSRAAGMEVIVDAPVAPRRGHGSRRPNKHDRADDMIEHAPMPFALTLATVSFPVGRGVGPPVYHAP